MSTTDRPAHRRDDRATAAARPPVVRVSVPERSLWSELRAIRIVWRRELIRFRADKLRMVTSLDPAAAVPVRARRRPADACPAPAPTGSP